MNALIAVTSAVTLAAFTYAAVLAGAAASRSRQPGRRAALLVLCAAMLLYVFVSFSNLLQYTGVTGAFDELEDYAEILFAPLIVFAVYASEAQYNLNERTRAARLLQQQNDMLVTIVDTTPAGILVVGPEGHITFANDPARNMLEIREDEATGMLVCPDWQVAEADGAPTSLSRLVHGGGASGRRCVLTWPDGRRGQFMFTVTPMSDATELLGGAVVAVEGIA